MQPDGTVVPCSMYITKVKGNLSGTEMWKHDTVMDLCFQQKDCIDIPDSRHWYAIPEYIDVPFYV